MSGECWYHVRAWGTSMESEKTRQNPAVFYARHYCPSCKKLEIIPICDSCQREYRRQIEMHGRYPLDCDNCGKKMERHIVGRINDD